MNNTGRGRASDRSTSQGIRARSKLFGVILLGALLIFAVGWLSLAPEINGSGTNVSDTPPGAVARSTETANPPPTVTGSPVPAPTDTSGPAPTDTALPAPTETALRSPTETPVATFTQTIAPPPTETATAKPTETTTPTATPIPVSPEPPPTAILILSPDATTAALQPTAIPTPVPMLEQPEETLNIALMGTDITGGVGRTDTLILVSVDPNLPSVSLLSIPRDLYVYIPGWQMQRINTADPHGERVGYPGGGPGLVKATIEYNLGVRVHYFVRVDFDGFINIIDTLGGIDVVVDCELHDTFPDEEAEEGSGDIDLEPGVHHLDGKSALWYARSRWDTNDFDRGRRQQRVLRGAFAQIKQLGLLSKLPELWDDLMNTIQTDIPPGTAIWLAQVAGRLDTGTALKSRFIDSTVVQGWRTPEGAAVQLPENERIGLLIAEALAPPDTARSRQRTPRVEVLNGTTWPEWGILAADRLVWEGFDIVNIGRADRADYRQTTLVDITERSKGSPIDLLARILRVTDANIIRHSTAADEPPSKEAAGKIEASPEPDFRVIVGYDYWPCYKSYWRDVHGSTP